jgi:hypothetical protein
VFDPWSLTIATSVVLANWDTQLQYGCILYRAHYWGRFVPRNTTLLQSSPLGTLTTVAMTVPTH